MNFIRKIIVLFLLTHLVASAILHRPLVWLCKYSGKDNYFWSKVAFWAGIGFCIPGVFGLFNLVAVYFIASTMVPGMFFYLPSVANKMRKSDGESLPIEIIAIPSVIIGHLWNMGLFGFFIAIGEHSFFGIGTFAGFLFNYTATCFLIDPQNGGKSLFKRASERIKKAIQATKERLGSEGAMPQPV